MLHASVLLKKTLIAVTTFAVTTVSLAQSTPKDLRGAPLSPDDLARFQSLTRDLEEQAKRGAHDPLARRAVQEQVRRIDDIADPRMAAEREKIMTFLGIDPKANHSSYIFVSWSMPLDVLRAYAVEAMWSGSTLVFRGIPKGRKLNDFFLKDLRLLVWDKNASANISIDPRLYDQYHITVVPTMVLTRTRSNPACTDGGEREVLGPKTGRKSKYSLCPTIAADKFVKISGAVTVDFALDAFKSAGFSEADIYLSALRRGYPGGQRAPRDQQFFKGNWNDVLGPLMDQYGPPRKIDGPTRTPH